ncbi:unnamed protein product [Pylaiella littoralis]
MKAVRGGMKERPKNSHALFFFYLWVLLSNGAPAPFRPPRTLAAPVCGAAGAVPLADALLWARAGLLLLDLLDLLVRVAWPRLPSSNLYPLLCIETGACASCVCVCVCVFLLYGRCLVVLLLLPLLLVLSLSSLW